MRVLLVSVGALYLLTSAVTLWRCSVRREPLPAPAPAPAPYAHGWHLDVAVACAARDSASVHANHLDVLLTSMRSEFAHAFDTQLFVFDASPGANAAVEHSAFATRTRDDGGAPVRFETLNASEHSSATRRQASDFFNIWTFGVAHFESCAAGGIGYFLFMEDDYEACATAAMHLLRTYSLLAALPDAQRPPVVRLTYGFSGLLLRCADVPRLVELARQRIALASVPLDWVLPELWARATGSTRSTSACCEHRHALTYRFALFEHQARVPSSVGNSYANANATQRSYGHVLLSCMSPIVTGMVHAYDRFARSECAGLDWSPCTGAPYARVLGAQASLLDVVGAFGGDNERFSVVEAHAAGLVVRASLLGEPCSLVCTRANSTCSERWLPAVNNCRDMRTFFNCTSCADDHHVDPTRAVHPAFYRRTRACVLNVHRGRVRMFDCNSRDADAARLCTCTGAQPAGWPLARASRR